MIKANLPARISFRVSSKIDSRTILDGNGAEQLLGKGDMLYLPPASSRFVRLHGPYISEQESARLASFLRKQGKPTYDTTITEDDKKAGGDLEFEKDDLYDEAARIVVSSGQASISYLQRRLRIGFSRAARLVDMMEAEGLVSPARRRQGARGAREEGLLRGSGRAAPMSSEGHMKRTLAAVVVAVACLAPVNDALARDSVRGLYTARSRASARCAPRRMRQRSSNFTGPSTTTSASCGDSPRALTATTRSGRRVNWLCSPSNATASPPIRRPPPGFSHSSELNTHRARWCRALRK